MHYSLKEASMSSQCTAYAWLWRSPQICCIHFTISLYQANSRVPDVTLPPVSICRQGGQRRAAGGPAYIKVHESEIADDYPAPAMYERADEEADELLLCDDDAGDVAPEDLPRRLLSEFAVYNSEVRSDSASSFSVYDHVPLRWESARY